MQCVMTNFSLLLSYVILFAVERFTTPPNVRCAIHLMKYI